MSLQLKEILTKIPEALATIPSSYNTLLDNLKAAESGYLHYNDTEEDITTGYGIYKKEHPNNLIFKYIEDISKQHTVLPTTEWKDKSLLAVINNDIDKNVERYLTYLFYKEYLEPAHLDLFTSEMVMVMVNLYTNSPLGAWKSIQEGLRDLSKDGVLPLKLDELSTVDGVYGGKTELALLAFKNIETQTVLEKILINKLFRKSVLLAMKTFYTRLGSGNPDKFLGYIKGWDNRIEELEHI